MRVSSHSRPFYDAFAGLAQRVRESAVVLDRIIREPASSAELLEELTVLDHDAAELRAKVIGDIDNVVVTPLPREDVHRVASLLGDTVHLLNSAAQHTQTLHLTGTQADAAELSGVVVRAAECIEATVASFRQRDYPTARCEDMAQLKDEGSAIWARAVEALFQGTPDAMEVLRWKEVYDQLQEVLEQCGALDHALDSIVLQNRG